MSNRTLNTLIIISLAGILGLFITNILPIVWPQKYDKFIRYNDVKGISIQHAQKDWTLNFDQQTKLIDYLNEAILVKKDLLKNNQAPLPFTSITIYRFEGSDIVLKALGKIEKNLVFAAPQWAADTYLQDVSEGGMQTLLEKSYP